MFGIECYLHELILPALSPKKKSYSEKKIQKNSKIKLKVILIPKSQGKIFVRTFKKERITSWNKFCCLNYDYYLNYDFQNYIWEPTFQSGWI